MDEVAGGLFVGAIEDAGDESLLRERGITTIVSLTYNDPDGGFPSDVEVVDLPMMDGPRTDRETFVQAVTETRSCLAKDERILVHCSAGASRSPTIAATALALDRGISIKDAFQQVAERRTVVDPHEALVRQAANLSVD